MSAATSPDAVEPDHVAAKLSTLDRFLPVWIGLAMASGLLLGRLIPGLNDALDSIKIGTVSLPIAIGLLAMMYPVLAKVRYRHISDELADRRTLGLSLTMNWLIGPALMFTLAWTFLRDLPELRTGLIIVGLARCIAMVLIWNDLACGSRELAAGLVAINSVFQIVMYSVLGWFYLSVLPGWLGLGTADLHVAIWDIAKSVLVFLGIPLAAGYLTRRILEPRKGTDWYEHRFLPRIGPVALYGLLFTIVVLFALQGDQITNHPLDVIRVAVPLLIYFAVMWTVSFATAYRLHIPYERNASIAFTAAGNNFELAIAVAIGVFGVTSGQALAGTIGPLIEVPALLALVYVSQARIAELTAAIDDLDGQIAELKKEARTLEGKVKLADAERRAAPSGKQVREARQALDRASDRVYVAHGADDRAEEAYLAADNEVRQTIVALNRTSSQFGLSTEERELNRLAANLRTIHRTAGNLAAQAVAVTGAERAAKRSFAVAAERRSEADTQAAVAHQASGNAREDTAAYDQLHRSVGAGAKEAEAALDKVTTQLRKLTKDREDLHGELERLNRAQGIAEETLKTSEREAAEASATRDAAGAAFRALADNGLPNDGRIDLGEESLTNVSSILRAARLVNRAVPDEPDANRLASQLLQLDDERHKAQTELATQAEIGLTQIEGTDEQLSVSRAFATVEGVDMTIAELTQRFANDLDRARRELEAKETELFEQTLTGSLRAHLASRLRAAQGLVDGMNDLLATIRTASGGVAVSLRWEVSDQVDDQDILTKIKNLLLQDHHTDTERSTLFGFLTRRIDLVRSDDRAAGSWRDALEQLFDYRRWHRFRLMVRHDRFGDRPVAFSSRNVSLSAGEKSLVLSLPLFAAIASHYMPRDTGGDAPACPRLLLLDEVFPKNDRPNKRQILRLLTDLDLDCVLTSDKDMCDYDTVDGIAIAVIAKDGDASFATRLVWNGTETVPEPPSIEP